MRKTKDPLAVELGRRGGRSKSPAKVEAVRANALRRARRLHPDDLRFIAAAIIAAGLGASSDGAGVAEGAWRRLEALEAAARKPLANGVAEKGAES